MGFTETRGRPEPCTESRHKYVVNYEVEGGCRENPGVWSLGGSRMKFCEHCLHCGQKKQTTGDYVTNEWLITYPKGECD